MFGVECVYRFAIMGRKKITLNIQHQSLLDLKIFNGQKKQDKDLPIRV